MARREVGVFAISVAAEMTSLQIQNIRVYERRGLVDPDRTAGGTRLYSEDDIDRLHRIRDLLAAGLNLAGIATPWVAGDWVFVVTDRAQLLAVARASGRIRWISQLPAYRDEEDREGPIFWRGPILAGNRLILTSSRGQIAYVSPTDGTVLATTETRTPFSLPPVVANNMLYVLDDSGRLTAWR